MSFWLYGAPGSLYTAKARAYLIKQGIAFANRAAGEAAFRESIAPAIGRWIIPVLQTPDGALVQDTSDIIEYFERAGPTRYPALPATPLHRLISHIFELFGGEGLLRPAMHYRWNFDAENFYFLRRDFALSLAPTGADEATQQMVFEMAATRMRRAMSGFGVSAATIPTIEASYATFLNLFEAHLTKTPFLLGGRPTLGDYALNAPLYAHLGRDPRPARLMQETAYRVWRWVERMRAPDQDAGEYGSPPEALFADDGVPDTLRALLRFVAEDYLPEIAAHLTFTNDWLARHPAIAAGTLGTPRPGDRLIGQAEFEWRGHLISTAVLPYRFYLLQKIQACADQAGQADRAAMDALLADTGLSALLTLRTTRQLLRAQNLEFWGPTL